MQYFVEHGIQDDRLTCYRADEPDRFITDVH